MTLYRFCTALLLALTLAMSGCGGSGDGSQEADQTASDGGGASADNDGGSVGGDSGSGDNGGSVGGDSGSSDNGGAVSDDSLIQLGAPGITLYLHKPDSWAEAKVHFWNALPAGVLTDSSWPGNVMAAIGNGWYAYHFPAVTAVNVVFNSGDGQQTADLSRTSSACYQDNSWVEMADCNAPPAPIWLGAAPAATTFYASSLDVTLGLMGAASDAQGRYTLDGSDPAINGLSFSNGQILNLGATLAVGDSLTLRTSFEGASYSAVYTKGDPSSGLMIYAKAPEGWNGINAHYWSVLPAGIAGDTSWPGVAMKDLGDNWYRLFLTGAESASLIFSDAGGNQTANLSRASSGCYDIAAASWSDSCDVPALPPSVAVVPDGKRFTSSQLALSLAVDGDNVAGGFYTTDGSDPKINGRPFVNGDSLTIGQTMAVGDAVTLRLYASNGSNEVVATATYVKAPTPPANAFSWDNATVYFLLTDRFADGDSSNNNSYGREQAPSGAVYDGYSEREGTFHGGDFKGVINKLNEGYFTDLGVNVLWLTAPYEQIHGFVGGANFKHYAYHGYYALDFTSVDANLGSEADLHTLIDTAHRQGIRVIFDIVMNHAGYDTMGDMDELAFGALKTGWQNYYYTADASSIHYDSYATYIDTSTAQAEPWGQWWGPDWIRKGSSDAPYPGYTPCGGDDLTMCLSGLPDFKTESMLAVGLPPLLRNKWGSERSSAEQAELDSFFADTNLPPTVANHLIKWMSDWVRDYGVDGFRVDTAKHVGLPVWAELKKQSALAYEQWKDANPDKLVDDQDLPFWMTGEVWGHGVGRSSYFDQGFDSLINFSFQSQAGNLANLESLYSDYAAKINSDASFNMLSYISSHDTSLFDRGNLVAAGTSLLLLPGAVQIFYGDETARPADSGFHWDQPTRSMMNWGSEDMALLAHWQKLGQFRARHRAIGGGSHQQLQANPYVFSRSLDGDNVVVALGAAGTVVVPTASLFAEGVQLRDGYSGQTATVINGQVTLTNVATPGVVLLERAL